MLKKTIYLVVLIFLVTSCADTLGSVKRGLTGEKVRSTDEFLIQKKDPLILPPDFENLPTPSESKAAREEISNIKKTLKKTISTESTTSADSSTEEFILQQIKKN